MPMTTENLFEEPAKAVGNWPLLIQTLDFILDNRDKWDQGDWVSECGTTACVAGWVNTFGGMKPIVRPVYLFASGDPVDFLFDNPYGPLYKQDDAFATEPYYYWPSDERVEEFPDRLEGEEALSEIVEKLKKGTVYAPKAAEELLGVGAGDAIKLFNGDNDLARIMYLVTEWAAADGVTLPDRYHEIAADHDEAYYDYGFDDSYYEDDHYDLEGADDV